MRPSWLYDYFAVDTALSSHATEDVDGRVISADGGWYPRGNRPLWEVGRRSCSLAILWACSTATTSRLWGRTVPPCRQPTFAWLRSSSSPGAKCKSDGLDQRQARSSFFEKLWGSLRCLTLSSLSVPWKKSWGTSSQPLRWAAAPCLSLGPPVSLPKSSVTPVVPPGTL